MFSFFPQLLIIIALVGMIAIILRKTPEVTGLPVAILARRVASKLSQAAKLSGQKLWQFTLEVKDLSAKPRAVLKRFPQALPRTFAKINLPKNLFSKLARGSKKSGAEDPAEKESRFIKIIGKDPHNEKAFAGLAELYLSQNKHAEALETYQFLVKHYPQTASYHEKLGDLYLHQKKLFHKAVEEYEKAIELIPASAGNYINLGMALAAQSHVEEALLNFRRAIDLEPTNPHFLMVFAENLEKNGEFAAAAEALQKVLELEPTNYLAREKLMHIKF